MGDALFPVYLNLMSGVQGVDRTFGRSEGVEYANDSVLFSHGGPSHLAPRGIGRATFNLQER